MPCYTVQTVSVEFKAENLDLLRQALSSLDTTVNETGYGLRVYMNGDTIDIYTKNKTIVGENMNNINKIKRQYSMEVVTKMAAKKRWILKKQSEAKMTLRRY